MTHVVTIAPVSDYTEKVEWVCSCGTGRAAATLSHAGSEAQSHLRWIAEGL
jgi:hypothetical protein